MVSTLMLIGRAGSDGFAVSSSATEMGEHGCE